MAQNKTKTTKALFVALALGLSAGCGGNTDYSGGDSGTVDYSRSEGEIKEDLGTRERMSPTSYLDFKGEYRQNIIGETVIEGRISNSAAIASFKDVVLHVTGYSKTNSEVGTWEETVYEVIQPGRSKQIKVKMVLPSTVKSIDVGIHDATSVD